MNSSDVSAILSQALWTMLIVGGPIVIVSMVVGLAISVLQAATQINEATLTFVPKLVITAAILVLFGGVMMNQLLEFTRFVFRVAAEGRL